MIVTLDPTTQLSDQSLIGLIQKGIKLSVKWPEYMTNYRMTASLDLDEDGNEYFPRMHHSYIGMGKNVNKIKN